METSESLFILSRRAYHAMERAYDLALAPVGLRAVDLETLMAIERGSRSLVSIARATGWKRSAFSKRIRRLERAGVVLVDRANPRRSYASLTPTGVEFLEVARSKCEQLDHQLASSLRGAAPIARTVLNAVAALGRRPVGDFGKNTDEISGKFPMSPTGPREES